VVKKDRRYDMLVAGIDMKRDMDLIRQMLLAVEEHPSGRAPSIDIDGYTQADIGYHAILLSEAGLVKINDVILIGEQSPRATITRLTWEGHEFLDSARENRIWNRAKDNVAKIGGASLKIWLSLLTQYVKEELGINLE